LNVAQQNAITRERLFNAAAWFRQHAHEVPAAVLAYLRAKGIDLREAIEVDFEDLAALGMPDCYRGLVVTPQARFLRWELELDAAGVSVPASEVWRDCSPEYPISAHLPGTGRSFGFLCMEVLEELSPNRVGVVSHPE